MNPSSDITKTIKLLWLVASLVFVYFLIRLGLGVYTTQTTGLLRIVSSDNAARLSVSRVDTQAAYVGSGAANIRLAPGTYYVGASTKGKSALKIVVLEKQKSVDVSIDPVTGSSYLPSVEDIDFVGEDNLLKLGLTSTQLANIKQLFFQHNQSAKTITITGAVTEPRNRDSTSMWFGLKFGGSIDRSSYSAQLKYSGFDAVQLTLNDSSGKQLFAGSLPEAVGDE